MSLLNNDYPEIFQLADKSASDSQKYFILLIKTDFILLILAAILGSINVADENCKKIIAISGAVLLVGSLIVSIFIYFSPFEGRWYGARAVAESFKALTWKYIIGAHPFTLTSKKADENFLKLTKDVLAEKRHLILLDATTNITGEPITQKMKEVRRLTFQERLDFYVTHRIEDQKDWYKTKSAGNKRSRTRFFSALVVIHFVTVLLTFCKIAFLQMSDITPVLSALLVALLGWTQIRKFNELSVAYNLTYHELNLVKARKGGVVDEATLADFVSDAENAISREHTMWAARRDNV